MSRQISTTAVERLAKTFENHGGAQTVTMHGDTVRLTAATLRALLAERESDARPMNTRERMATAILSGMMDGWPRADAMADMADRAVMMADHLMEALK